MPMIAEATRSVNVTRLENIRQKYAVSAQLRLRETSFDVLAALHSRAGHRSLADEHALAVLECLAVTKDTRAAFDAYVSHSWKPMSHEAIAGRLPRAPWRDEVLVLEHGKLEFVGRDGSIDVRLQSAGTSVLVGLLGRERSRTPSLERTSETFLASLRLLTDMGVLAPPTGAVKWGDLARHEPFCGRYGSVRGTVVDRHYLERFLEIVGKQVRGRTIEVGTTILTENHQLQHPFPEVTDYQTLDLLPGDGVDICGDLSDRLLLERSSVDTILCFNVLEHCAEPQLVVDNMLRWLAPGGSVLCMVPSVQRVHEAPRDYWRVLPSGMDYLFRNFSQRELHVFGNLQTTIAALSGLATEDLASGALEPTHPDYPVATCIVARK